jgi:hypothetical protein
MGKLLIIVSLFIVSSSYATEMHHAIVLEHKSEISGSDDKGRAVDGHVETEGDNESSIRPKRTMTTNPRT